MFEILDLTKQMHDELAQKYGEISWKEALFEAKEYHHRKMSHCSWAGEDYDEDHSVYNGFRQSVKDALWYLYESGELDE